MVAVVVRGGPCTFGYNSRNLEKKPPADDGQRQLWHNWKIMVLKVLCQLKKLAKHSKNC